MKNKRILITGGAGFIGSDLTRQAAEHAAKVVVVDNMVNGKRKNLTGLPKSVELVVADIRDTPTMRELLQGIDIVYHLACLGVRHSIHSPLENHQVNAEATLYLLAAAREAGIKRFVYVSSSEIYGTAKWTPMTEDHPTYPATVYGASKLAGECYARAYYETYGFPSVVVRPFNAYGPRCHHEGDSGEVIPKFLLRALAGKPMVIFGDGSQTRDFTYVEDTARGILAAGIIDRAVGKTLNLGSGREISIGDLACLVGEVSKTANPLIVHDRPRPGDVLRLFADSSRAAEVLDFKPRVDFREGLSRLVQWYSEQGAAPVQLLSSETVRNWEGEASVA